MMLLLFMLSLLIAVVCIVLFVWMIPMTIFTLLQPKPHRNWRIFSPYHHLSDGPNGYYAWLSKHYPDWWKR